MRNKQVLFRGKTELSLFDSSSKAYISSRFNSLV